MAVTRTDLTNALAEKFDMPKAKMEAIVKAYEAFIVDKVTKGETVQFIKFAKFYRKDKAARPGHNPRTGAAINIPAKSVAKAEATFKLG